VAFSSIIDAGKSGLKSASFRLLAPVVRRLVERESQELRDQVRQLTDQLSRISLRESQLRAILARDIELEDEHAGLRTLLEETGAAAHIAGAIRRATLHDSPFPYAVIDEVLPKPLYVALLKGIPPAELFSDRPANKQQLTVPFAFAPAYSRTIWRFVTTVVVPDWLMAPLIDKFRGPLDDWITHNWPSVPPRELDFHTSDGRILRRVRGYRIPPHRDPKWAFLTGILYLARKHDSEAWGTQLYSVEADEEAPGPAPHWIDPARCRHVTDVTFRPNRLLVFLNSVGAHGAHIPNDAQPETLDRYIYQFRIAPTLESMAVLNGALPEDRRPLLAGKSADY
jgi:hypothetical protein